MNNTINPRNNSNIIKWVFKVIESCETYEQLESAKRLVKNYEKQYNDYHYFDLKLARQLQHVLKLKNNKWPEIY
jgi:hypothetical protein